MARIGRDQLSLNCNSTSIMFRVTWSKNWGFCSIDCEEQEEKKSKKLQETTLDILTQKDCQYNHNNIILNFESIIHNLQPPLF